MPDEAETTIGVSSYLGFDPRGLVAAIADKISKYGGEVERAESGTIEWEIDELGEIQLRLTLTF